MFLEKNELFEKRLKNFKSQGQLSAFNIACVAEAMDTVRMCNENKTGWETVEKRVGEYKSWDPEIIKIDKETENGYARRLTERGRSFKFLSEEAGAVDINPSAKGEKYYAVCDPFDGSFLYKYRVPAFWCTSLALYDQNMLPVCNAVGDCCQSVISWANDKGAFRAKLEGDKLSGVVRLDGKYRKSTGFPDVTEIAGASIESYVMKPSRFLIPLVDQYRDLIAPFKFLHPNGGPYGFLNVAQGLIDCYFAPRLPFVDMFSGIFIALQAGAIVTDFDGNLIKFVDNDKTVWDVVASTNQVLHGKILAVIAECKKKNGSKA
jgi:fructose-1,6-bisphosphatase/inositol monophosphatase family enzyme